MMNRYAPFVPVALLGLGVLLVSGLREQFTMQARQPMSSIPVRAAGAEIRDVVVDSVERRVAGFSDYMIREVGPKGAFAYSVYVGYYDKQVQGKSIHSPKNCLPGAGWEILTSERIALAGAPAGSRVNRVILANKGTQAMVYYWYQGRGRIEASEYRVKWDLMRDAALHGRTEEALARIVIPLDRRETNDPSRRVAELARADALGARVAQDLSRSVTAVLPAWPSSSGAQ